MPKPTVHSLSIIVSELHREVVALREELAALKRPRPAAQPELPVAEAIKWLNEHSPAKSYTRADIERAAKEMRQ